MECQNTIRNLKINKNKSIGEIIIVVEGESDEFRLLKHIFTKVLNYNYVTIKRNKIMQTEFRSKNNPNSTVIVANTSNSNIKSIMEDENYQDKLYKLLKTEYNKSLKNVPIYILWDKDVESNEEKVVLKTLKTFQNSLDNDEEMNGILLLSYPCLESYEISNFNKQLYRKRFTSSLDAKKFYRTKKYSIKHINEKTLLNAIINMHRSMIQYGIKKYDPSDFYSVNKKIYDNEQKIFIDKHSYDAISLISVIRAF